MGRHIVSISLRKIKNQRELMDIFYSDYINERKIPMNKRLYVLEDIDCGEMEDIVRERSNSKEGEKLDDGAKKKSRKKSKETPDLNINLAMPPSINHLPGGVSYPMDESDLTLADILEALDGAMEMRGRMMVITTNYPEKLDTALTRPGRIDIKLNFKRCTSKSLVQMFEYFCGTETLEAYNTTQNNNFDQSLDNSWMPGDRWTPAQVAQILVRNIRVPMKALEGLLHGQTKSDISHD